MNPPMITESDIYWITRFDNIHVLSGFLILLPVVFLLFFNLACLFEGREYAFWAIFLNVLASCLLVVGILGVTFVPTTKEMIVIKVVPKIANSEFVQTDLPREVKEMYGIAKDYLKSKLTEKPIQNKDEKK